MSGGNQNNQSLGNKETSSWVLRTKYSPTIYYRTDGLRPSTFPINRAILDREALLLDLKKTSFLDIKPSSHPVPTNAALVGSQHTSTGFSHPESTEQKPSSVLNEKLARPKSRSFYRCPSPEPRWQDVDIFKDAKETSKRFSSPQRRKSISTFQSTLKHSVKSRGSNKSPGSPLIGFSSPSRSPDLSGRGMKQVSSWSKFIHNTEGSMKAVETAKEWMVDLSKLFVGSKFASGAYSRLYHGLYDEKPVAIKIILQPEEDENEDLAIRLERQFDREVTILSHLHHRNIVQLVAACRNPPVFCIITEYLSGGSLRSYLQKKGPGSVSLDEFLSISLDIARGMEYLHSQGVIHRDLKSENLLFTEDNKCLKIVDFGIACEEINVDCLEEDRGTYRWMAPEVINHKPHNKKVDVYSFGIVLWEIITGKIPYEDMIPVQAAFAVVHKNARPAIPEHCPPPIQKLMEKCWSQNPDKRPESWQIVKILEQFEHALHTDGTLNQCQVLCINEKKHGVHRWKKLGGRISGTAAISPSPSKGDLNFNT
eukprot:TRINITY_DN40158_c0_g1_i1.p2 TRINITY_DN40158_c0_g1~~TRINITY_DN40158_c0_g1_i1.p2  ORF type:complete len:538 (-),score=92.25 TRINITY_DN40158_c0_g1_i1:2298-3911(-)